MLEKCARAAVQQPAVKTVPCPSPGRRPAARRASLRAGVVAALTDGRSRGRGEERRRVPSCWRRARFSRASSVRVRRAERRVASRFRRRASIGSWRMMALDGCLTYGFLNLPTEKRRRGWRGGEPHPWRPRGIARYHSGLFRFNFRAGRRVFLRLGLGQQSRPLGQASGARLPEAFSGAFSRTVIFRIDFGPSGSSIPVR
jgi:hypothetical protein